MLADIVITLKEENIIGSLLYVIGVGTGVIIGINWKKGK